MGFSQSRTAHAETFVEISELLLVPQLGPLNAAGMSPCRSENYVQNYLGGFLGTVTSNTKESDSEIGGKKTQPHHKKTNKTNFCQVSYI